MRILIGIMTVLALILLLLLSSYIGANNYGAKTEALLDSARDNNQNILAQYEQRILEMVQVPEMYKNDMKEIVKETMQGRYGADGSKAMFQWIQERNIEFDSAIYTRVQDAISSGRKDFELGQTRMLDIRKGYEAQLGYAWRGLWLRIAGFPKIDLDDYDPIITNRVETTYENGKESGPLKLR